MLGLRAQRILSALDPSWVRTTRRETLGRRRLVKGTYSTGIGYLGLYDIGVPGMAGAYEHVNAIARGIKRLGDPRTLDQLRADTALDLLTGGTSPLHAETSTGKTRTTPASKPPTEPAEYDERPDAAAAEPDTNADADATDADTTKRDGRRGDARGRHEATAASRVEAAKTTPTGDQHPEAAASGAKSTAGSGSDTEDDVTGAGARTEQTAAEPDTTHPEAKLEAEAPVPAPYPVPRARADVDLIVSINTLANLADALRRDELIEIGGYGLVPADVAARLVKAAADRPSTWCLTVIDDTGRVIEHVRTSHDPTRVMREYVNARDRHCRFPGCTVTAVRCDQDHTTSWETGGATCPCNLTPLCRRHHRLKQAQGFDLSIDAETNTATWTTPHTHGTTTPPWTAPGHHDPPPPF